MFSLRSDKSSEGELIPGTEVLLQTNDGLRSSSELILVPEPSNSPDDPLVSTLSPLLCYFVILTTTELESKMEGHCPHQPSHLRVHLYPDTFGYRTSHADLHPRVPHHSA